MLSVPALLVGETKTFSCCDTSVLVSSLLFKESALKFPDFLSGGFNREPLSLTFCADFLGPKKRGLLNKCEVPLTFLVRGFLLLPSPELNICSIDPHAPFTRASINVSNLGRYFILAFRAE
ncbi:hypothetical protein AX774_g6427 [Zancudomyces culisetae]|uniref:Uncharacterized protein n=1 Tax=Zancudomyces culisetae TaxID=1213189 RepID=A0A1R1PGN1_ZANCU|nr:hypothetical protein AX774_g6427 [Zancudomyces culisetae]|eukprot:OMH80136.1 hypothetical protein AX774_g6427 [Zancudomyces culisetae]